jgi:uroporphyrinogen III methyltransferase/synthase
VLVTRPAEEAAALADALRDLGAEPVLAPAIEVRPLEDPSALDAALRAVRAYDWVVFTSANGVRHVWRRLEALGLGGALEDGEHGRPPGVPRVAAIGPATAAALERRGVRPDFVPAAYVAEALGRDLPLGPGARVLCLRADLARPALREILARRGAEVDDVAAYRTGLRGAAAGGPGGPDLPPRGAGAEGSTSPAEAPDVDVVTFTSPSTVRGHVARFGRPPPGVSVVCIGPVTADAARELGLEVHAVAARYTVPGLLEALGRLRRPEPASTREAP